MSLTQEEQAEFDALLAAERAEEEAAANTNSTGSETPAEGGEVPTEETPVEESVVVEGETPVEPVPSEETPEVTDTEASGATGEETPETPAGPSAEELAEEEARKAAEEQQRLATEKAEEEERQRVAEEQRKNEELRQQQEAAARAKTQAKIDAAKQHQEAISSKLKAQATAAPDPVVKKEEDPFETNTNLAFVKRTLVSYVTEMAPNYATNKKAIVDQNHKLLRCLKTVFTKFEADDFKEAMRYIDKTIREHVNGAFAANMIARQSVDSGKEYIAYTQALVTLSTTPKENRRQLIARFPYERYFGAAAGRVNDFYRSLVS